MACRSFRIPWPQKAGNTSVPPFLLCLILRFLKAFPFSAQRRSAARAFEYRARAGVVENHFFDPKASTFTVEKKENVTVGRNQQREVVKGKQLRTR
jgi:hypothetical protein